MTSSCATPGTPPAAGASHTFTTSATISMSEPGHEYWLENTSHDDGYYVLVPIQLNDIVTIP